jgi:hypothetical protein
MYFCRVYIQTHSAVFMTKELSNLIYAAVDFGLAGLSIHSFYDLVRESHRTSDPVLSGLVLLGATGVFIYAGVRESREVYKKLKKIGQ